MGGGPEHQDCNGKTAHPHHHAHILAEVFPQLKARKDRADTDEEIDYVSRRRRSAQLLQLFYPMEFAPRDLIGQLDLYCMIQ